MDELLKAWMAGFVDGDGSIAIAKATNAGPDRSEIQYRLVVVITNCDPNAFHTFYQNFGGYFYQAQLGWQRAGDVPAKTTRYQWTLTGAKASDFLQEILPHLRSKMYQAQLGIQFQNTVSRGQPISKEVFEERERLYNEMKVLNMMYGKGRGQKRKTRKSPKKRES